MTEQITRHAPTPLDLAARPAAALTAPAPVYDRYRWEAALIDADLPHHAARLLGWGLAHLAGEAGYLAPGTAPAGRLARRFRLSGKQIRLSLSQLEHAGLISRPDIHTWRPQDLIRPITLTLPAADDRQEPPSTGAVPE